MHSVIVGGRAGVFSSHPHFKAICILTRGPDAVHLDLKAFFIYLQLEMLSFDSEKKPRNTVSNSHKMIPPAPPCFVWQSPCFALGNPKIIRIKTLKKVVQ